MGRCNRIWFIIRSISVDYCPISAVRASANSLHYGVNIFPAITEHCTKYYFDYFISHEIGTHILKPHTLDKAQVSEKNHRIYYIAFENLAKHINMKILSNKYWYELVKTIMRIQFLKVSTIIDALANDDIGAKYFAAHRPV